MLWQAIDETEGSRNYLTQKADVNTLAGIKSSLAQGTASSASPNCTDVPRTGTSDPGQSGYAFPAWRRHSSRSASSPPFW
jgi:hypothetical protein